MDEENMSECYYCKEMCHYNDIYEVHGFGVGICCYEGDDEE